MTSLSKLKLINAQVTRKTPMVLRRNKLTGKIDDQIAFAKALGSGTNYAAKRLKFVQDTESGQRKQVEITTRVKQWWWTASNGKIILALRYGAKPLEISKGKNGIEVGSMDELLSVLQTIKDAVAAGELDAQIEHVSGSLRAGFARKEVKADGR